MEKAILDARKAGESLGGTIECIVLNVPAGVGEPLFDSLDGDLAKAIFTVPAVKGVEFGAGFSFTEMKALKLTTLSRCKTAKFLPLQTLQAAYLAASPQECPSQSE